jgi:hypothetical protein
LYLPVDPLPGFGGLLLGGILAQHVPLLDEDEVIDVQRLLSEIDRGARVVQPRLRHRFQVDRHGLALSTHRMVATDESFTFEFNNVGTGLQQVLGSLYALERLDDHLRHQLIAMMRRAITWRGPLGPSFVSYLSGHGVSSVSAITDPRAWALDVLGFPGGIAKISKKEIMARYRDSLRRVHPDHGGSQSNASKAIEDITEARRVLLTML